MTKQDIEILDELVARLEWAIRFIETYARKDSGQATPEIKACRAAIKMAKEGTNVA